MSLKITRFIPFILLLWLCSLAAQENQTLTVIVKEGQSMRDLAALHLGDANLWEELLTANGLQSAAEIKPGMTLRVRRDYIGISQERLSKAQKTIGRATDLGAKVFAEELMTEALSSYNKALAHRRKREWQQSIALAIDADIKAEQAYKQTKAKRNIATDATLTDRKGQVEKRKPADNAWFNAPLMATFNESDRVRTLSKSYAEITFQDASRIRLNENSQAVIQSMRVDLLEKKRESSVSLVKGDAFAFLNTSEMKRKFEVNLPGVSTKVNSRNFWMQKGDDAAKFANYDGEIAITSKGTTIVIGKNEGSTVATNERPTAARRLLSQPTLIAPSNNGLEYIEEVTLKWSPVQGAVSYWLEISSDERFENIVVSERDITATSARQTLTDDSRYFWHVAAMDADGFPGQSSATGFFQIDLDTTPPYLIISSPYDGEIFSKPEILVVGVTGHHAQVSFDGKSVIANEDGSFQATKTLQNGSNQLQIAATDLAGNTNSKALTVMLDPDTTVVINYDPHLKQTTPKSFITASQNLTLKGLTSKESVVTIARIGGRDSLRTVTASDGNFQFILTNLQSSSDFMVRAQTPLGHTAIDTISVEIDTKAPQIFLETDIPQVTTEDRLRIKGAIDGADNLTLNGNRLAVTENRFNETVVLKQGRNQLRLAATDRVGNTTVQESWIVLDNNAPLLTDCKVVEIKDGAGKKLRIELTAVDGSPMKRTASISVQIGNEKINSYLIFNSANNKYEGEVKLLGGRQGGLTLHSVELEDYHGNKKTYYLKDILVEG